MNSQELRTLQEAYLEVYEEKGDIKDRDEKASKQKADARMSGTKSITAYQSSAGYISKGEGEQRLNTVKKKINKELEKRKEKVGNRNLTFSRTKGDDALKMGKSPRNQKEETDLYDIILSHLLDEGYAETPEAAEAIMVNMSEDWRESIVEEVLDEAEGSYGQTPKASAAYTALHTGKGKSKTKSLALKHAIRAAGDDNSNKPSPKRSKMTQSDRDYHRGQSENGGEDREGIDFDEFDTGASGPGGKPKGKKLERQRKTGVSAD